MWCPVKSVTQVLVINKRMGDPQAQNKSLGGKLNIKYGPFERQLTSYPPTQAGLFYRWIDSAGLDAEPEDEMASQGLLHSRVLVCCTPHPAVVPLVTVVVLEREKLSTQSGLHSHSKVTDIFMLDTLDIKRDNQRHPAGDTPATPNFNLYFLSVFLRAQATCSKDFPVQLQITLCTAG